MGISREAHRSIVFGTAQFGGLDLGHLAAYQGQPFAILNGPSSLQQHDWEDDALNAGLYTIGMWMYGKCTGARLRKVFTGSHDRKLDYWNMGTSALV
jgi:hypothetical protein